MIAVDTPTRMTCDEPGCDKSIPVQLVLTGMGMFAFKPSEKNWQVILPNADPAAPFGSRCPAHKKAEPVIQTVQIGPRGPRLNHGH